MPINTWGTKADFDAGYNVGAEPDTGHPNTRPEVRVHYNRCMVFPYVREQTLAVASVLGWTPASRIIIVGCGFGWSLEVLADELGIIQTIGTDTSAWIQSVKDQSDEQDLRDAISEAGLRSDSGNGLSLFNRLVNRWGGPVRSRVPAKIINDDLTTPGSHRAVFDFLPGNGDFEVFSELAESFDDAENVAFSEALWSLRDEASARVSRVTRLVGQPPLPGDNNQGFNWKTLEEWKALAPADLFIESGMWRVL